MRKQLLKKTAAVFAAIAMLVTSITFMGNMRAEAASLLVEAENYDYMSGIQVESCSEGGSNVGYIESGDWMSYTVDIPTAGTYQVDLRVASPDGSGTIYLEQNSGTTRLAQLSVPRTGGWQNWTTISTEVYLSAGVQSVGVATSTGGFNLNWLKFTSVESGVTMYLDSNYSGTSATFGVGRYNMSDMVSRGIPNDKISSLKVAPGYKVTVYYDINFSGSSQVFTENTSYVGDYWNDQITSFVVEQLDVVTMYLDSNYSGTSASFNVGRYNLSDMVSKGIPNDKISSLKVASGYKVTVYYDINFSGSSQVFTADTSYVGDYWNDQITSFIVEKNTSGNNNNNNNNNSSSDIPQTNSSVPARSDRMYFLMNNKTNGKYSDSQVYWCILGYNSSNQLCYVDKDGNMIPATTALNTIEKNGRQCADICYSLAEKNYVYMPDIVSGRMYLSYGSPVYITINTDANGRAGYAGPDLNNTSDPNQDVLFEFIEFTIKNKEYWGNTSRVDFFSFPMATRLIGTGGYNNTPGDTDVYDKTVGDIGTRDEIFAAFKAEVPSAFKELAGNLRIMAPCKSVFNEGCAYSNYFDNYINTFWNKYTHEDLVFTCDAGTFRGRVYGNSMVFHRDGDNGTYTIYKPTTQDVLEGKGNFNRGNSTELVIEAQLCAAFNRGVALEPQNWNNSSAYYQSSPSNYYAGFFHNHAYDRLAYGFCYDDVFDHSTLLHYTNPTGLIIDLKW